MLVYTISKGTNKSFVYDIYHGVKGSQGPQGEQGIQGPIGPQGIPGTAATIQVGSVTSGIAPAVNNVGTDTAAVFDFVLEKGEQGPVGQAAGFGTPSAVASALPAGSTPTASVVASGDATQKVFDFSFGIPAGEQGIQGEQGPIGPTGEAAGFGTPTASATTLPAGSTPTASVSASGEDTEKVFAFEFGIPAGSESWNIEVNYFTSSSMVLKIFKNNVAYSGTIFAYLTYGDGTTSQRTSSPMMLTASSGIITITSGEFSDITTVLADAKKTNFYFEFQETFSGSIFYTVNYVRNGGAGFDPSSMTEITYPQILNNTESLVNKIKEVDNKRIEGDEAKINKVSNPTEGNIPVLTQDGSISDSSKKIADLMPSASNLSTLTNFSFITGDFVNSAPASSSSSGLKGQMYLDTDYIYYCVADNTWKRIALSTF